MKPDLSKLSDQELATLRVYEASAELYSNTRDPHFWDFQLQNFEKLLPGVGKWVLDVGCGTGRDAKFFVQNWYTYCGIDISPAMIAQAQYNTKQGTFFECSMYDIPATFAHCTFDGFWAMASLLHIPKSRIREVLKNIRHVVARGGIGTIAIKEGEGEEMAGGNSLQEKRFFSLYSQKEFASILIRNGFEILTQYKDFREIDAKEPRVWLIYVVRVR
jgi:SAM-dependent methyltransferase